MAVSASSLSDGGSTRYPNGASRNNHPAEPQLTHTSVRDNKMAVVFGLKVLGWLVMQQKITETVRCNLFLSGHPLPAQVPKY